MKVQIFCKIKVKYNIDIVVNLFFIYYSVLNNDVQQAEHLMFTTAFSRLNILFRNAECSKQSDYLIKMIKAIAIQIVIIGVIMKVVGLITEYNPFHNGHLYHIKEAKKVTGADYVIVVMSGNFVQRGTPALIDKYSRTNMALACGADIVFELPVCYSTASAEFFALGAVSLLDKLGIVTDICFGSECGDISALTSIAKILLEEPDEYKVTLNALIKEGKTFPTARMEALKTVAPNYEDDILSSPNNILGIEYIKALIRLKSNINPVLISRKTAGYHNIELTSQAESHNMDLTEQADSAISSATAIRKAIQEEKSLIRLKSHVPGPVYNILQNEYNKSFPVSENDFTLLLQYKLLQETAESLTSYTDVSLDLANRMEGICTSGILYEQYAQKIKSRQWTLTRVNRVMLHILLNLKAKNFMHYNLTGYTQYARLLGFRKSSSHLLRIIAKNNAIPVITKMADAKQILSKTGITMLSEDINAAHLYNNVIYNKYGTVLKDEYTRGVIVIK
jgi:predicted nucleotidyltransferase